MISPIDARKYIEFQNVDFGQNVTLPDVVDVCECEEFFGTRCDENVHVTGHKRAHIDRRDPRQDPLGHLKHDVGIPYSALTTTAGIIVGTVLSKNNRIQGAIIGGFIGLVIGIIADSAS